MNTFMFMNMNDKSQKAYRAKSYDEVLLDSILPMIRYPQMPETVNTRFLEFLRLIEGKSALWYLNGELIASHVNLGGEPYSDGLGSIAICVTNNGITREFKDWRNNPDVAIIFNTSSYQPDMNIGRFADLLTELETSMKFNILYSRLYPMPIAKDEHMKKAIESALNNMKYGQFVTLLDENAYDELFSDANGEVKTLRLTDPKDSETLQYLSKLRDDLFRWFYSLYGMNTQGGAKLAQMTESETEQNANASMIIPKNRLDEALIGCDMINKKFRLNVTAEFSECWQSKLEDLDADDDGVIDEPDDEKEDEPDESERDSDE